MKTTRRTLFWLLAGMFAGFWAAKAAPGEEFARLFRVPPRLLQWRGPQGGGYLRSPFTAVEVRRQLFPGCVGRWEFGPVLPSQCPVDERKTLI